MENCKKISCDHHADIEIFDSHKSTQYQSIGHSSIGIDIFYLYHPP